MIDVRRWIFAAALTLLAVAPGAAQAVGDKAAVVTVPDLDGKPVPLAVTPGRKAMVIEFWATWCEVCDALLPRMRDANARYKGRVDFYGVNVTVNESKARVQRFVAQHALPFRTLYDARGVAVRAYAAPATSYVVIVDAAGTIRYVGSGATQDISGELKKVVGT